MAYALVVKKDRFGRLSDVSIVSFRHGRVLGAYESKTKIVHSVHDYRNEAASEAVKLADRAIVRANNLRVVAKTAKDKARLYRAKKRAEAIRTYYGALWSR